MDNIIIFIINRLYPIKKLLKINSSEKNFRCLFHNDKKPSARIYSNSYWCFSCGRFFYPINIIRKKKIEINKLLNELLDEYKCSIEELYEIAKSKKNTNDNNNNVNNDCYKKSNNDNFVLFAKNFFLNKKEEN